VLPQQKLIANTIDAAASAAFYDRLLLMQITLMLRQLLILMLFLLLCCCDADYAACGNYITTKWQISWSNCLWLNMLSNYILTSRRK
jgi:hypothetical protein